MSGDVVAPPVDRRDGTRRVLVRESLVLLLFITLTVLMTWPLALHLSELRAALNVARAALGFSAVIFTDETLTAGATTIKAAHFMELRVGTR